MTVVYTNAKALMSVQATALSAEATSAGLTSLATALTNLATEINTNTGATDSEWVGTTTGLFEIYSQQLISAANIIRSHIINSVNTTLSVIRSDLDTIATNSTTIATKSTTIATNSTTIATNSTTMATLASSTGIHIVGPYDWLGLINVYRSLIEQGNIMDSEGNVSLEEQEAALAQVNEYISKIQQVPQSF